MANTNLLMNEIRGGKKAFLLTCDVDWASDFVIDDTLNFFNSLGVRVTWFATHETELNEKILASNHEIGIHPNFNFLLNGNTGGLASSYEGVVSKMLEYIPGAISMRSHSTAISSPILDFIKTVGINFESNIFVPYYHKILRPYEHYNGLLRVPYCWSDDVHLAYRWNYQSVLEVLRSQEFLCIDCHPIHIYLNSENLDRYDMARRELRDEKKLSGLRNSSSYGTRNFIEDLVKGSL